MASVTDRLSTVLALDKIDEILVLKTINEIFGSSSSKEVRSNHRDELISIQNELCARIFSRVVEAEFGQVR